MNRARVIVLAAGVLALAGCGGGGGGQARHARRGSRVVDIYSSLPLSGPLAPDGQELVRGMRLALLQAGQRGGGFQVRFFPLDDVRGGGAAFSAGTVAANAHRASTDPDAVAYIGEFSSPATEIAMPILNTGGLGQISPASTYPGLTVDDPGSRAEEPQRYYPTGSRTFARIVPRDTVEAAADLSAMRHDGCSRLAILRAGGYGARVAALLEYQRARFGMSVAGGGPFPESLSALRAAGLRLRASHVGCVYLGTTSVTRALAVTRALGAALPSVRFYASGVLCPKLAVLRGPAGLPPGLDQRVQCTELTQPVSSYPGSRQFLADYRLVYGSSSSPGPWSLYGYEAMRLALDSIASAGPGGNARGQVLRALLAGRLHHSLLGSYRLDSAGDTTLRAYGLYRGAPGGGMRFERTLVP